MLDPDLVSFVNSIPAIHKFKSGKLKRLLNTAFTFTTLPQFVIARIKRASRSLY